MRELRRYQRESAQSPFMFVSERGAPLSAEGSFSAAARKLRRAQSAVSELVSSLEDQIGVMLFDR